MKREKEDKKRDIVKDVGFNVGKSAYSFGFAKGTKCLSVPTFFIIRQYLFISFSHYISSSFFNPYFTFLLILLL